MCPQVQSPEWQSSWRAGHQPYFKGSTGLLSIYKAPVLVALRSGVGHGTPTPALGWSPTGSCAPMLCSWCPMDTWRVPAVSWE